MPTPGLIQGSPGEVPREADSSPQDGCTFSGPTPDLLDVNQGGGPASGLPGPPGGLRHVHVPRALAYSYASRVRVNVNHLGSC